MVSSSGYWPVIAFLVSPQSCRIKGADIPVDGGSTALVAADALGSDF